MSLIEVSSIPQVAVDFMNEVHLEEVEMINELHELLEKYLVGTEGEALVTTALHAVVAHTQAHFAREEAFMREGNFPPYAVHKAAHDDFLERFQKVTEGWESDKNSEGLNQFLTDQLPEWLERHISTMDFVTARFLSR